jgi:hypothetical protein
MNNVFRPSTRKDEMTGKMLPVWVENHKDLRTDEFENQIEIWNKKNNF